MKINKNTLAVPILIMKNMTTYTRYILQELGTFS